jgi:hypothetical protein
VLVQTLGVEPVTRLRRHREQHPVDAGVGQETSNLSVFAGLQSDTQSSHCPIDGPGLVVPMIRSWATDRFLCKRPVWPTPCVKGAPHGFDV